MTPEEKSFERLRRTWGVLGEEDPLWAILSEPDKQHGRWKIEEFFRTGDEVVERYRGLLLRFGAAEQFARVLDFGCGVGRLTVAWSRFANRVSGVDVSAPMIEKGTELVGQNPKIELVLNSAPDLRIFQDDSFDLVFSHIVLQHIPWEHAANYLREFGRVCRTDGWVAFQLPAKVTQARGTRGSAFRAAIIENLPFGLGSLYRRWRRGTPVVFDMHFTLPAEVDRVARQSGLRLLHREPDAASGQGTEGFIYLFRKSGSDQ